MNKNSNPSYIWSKQKLSADCQTIECEEYDPYKDFRRDPTGYYVLIAIEWDVAKIAVALCNKDHEIVRILKGRRAQDIYHTIFLTEKNDKEEWFKEKRHMAYLGKELKKAEIVLALGIQNYFQE